MRWWALLPVAALVLTGACGAAEPPPSATAPSASPTLASVIALGGRVLVTDRSDIRYTPDLDGCVTRGDSRDIAQGARVEVRNNRGHWTAVGALGVGHFVDGGTDPAGCVFEFNMTNAPGGSPSYRIRVAHRPPKVVDAADIAHIVLVVP
jgi:hypothetical protein